MQADALDELPEAALVLAGPVVWLVILVDSGFAASAVAGRSLAS